MFNAFDAIDRRNFADLRRAIFYKKVDFSAQNSDGDTILHVFIRDGLCKKHPDIFTSILSKNDIINIKHNKEEAALHMAVRNLDYSIVKELLANGAIPLLKSGENFLPIQLLQKNTVNDSAENIRAILTVAHSLIEGRMPDNIEEMAVENLLNIRDENNNTPLHVAVREGNKELVKLLLEKGAEVDEVNKDSDTPLHVAVREGNKELVELLLEKGAEVDELNKDLDTPLHVALRKGNKDLAKLLLAEDKIDCDTNSVDGTSPLYLALHVMKDIELVELLLEKGADVNAELVEGGCNRPLHYAIKHGYDECVRLLLNRVDIDLNVQDNNKDTPLHMAIINNQLDVVYKLLENGADPFLENNESLRPLDLVKKCLGDKSEDIIYEINKRALLNDVNCSVIPSACFALIHCIGYSDVSRGCIVSIFATSFVIKDDVISQNLRAACLFGRATCLVFDSLQDSCDYSVSCQIKAVSMVLMGVVCLASKYNQREMEI